MSSFGGSRRALLKDTCLGFGMLALHDLLREETQAEGIRGTDLTNRQTDHHPRVRSIIQLTQIGGPSQMDLFDPKTELSRFDGTIHKTKFETFQPGSESNTLMGSAFRFGQHGESGMWFSELLPHLASRADDLCQVRSMYSANNNHPQAQRFFASGKILAGWPTFGSWVCYALGAANRNLPAYVALRDPAGYTDGGTNHWDCGWLPGVFRGTEFRSTGDAVLNLHPSQQLATGVEARNLDFLKQLNRRRQRNYPTDTRLEARILNYELAARMQRTAEKVLDLNEETPATQQLYGLDNETTADFGRRCLMARRLVEAGVRFIQVMTPTKHGNSPWDNHSGLRDGLRKICPMVDQPSAALIHDLKQRGLLDSTIVIWSGEFGRLPISQNNDGRDHNRHAFSLLIAGGGFRSGYTHGSTDEFGYAAEEGPIGVHDLHATLLDRLGIDHTELGYPHNGRFERLTDPEVTNARVATELYA